MNKTMTAGPVRLVQIPETLLDRRGGFLLPEGSGYEDFARAAEWLARHGFKTAYFNQHGLLAITGETENGSPFYEWITQYSLLVPKDGELFIYGSSMLAGLSIDDATPRDGE